MFNIAKTIRVIKEAIIGISIKTVSMVVLKLINILNIDSYILILQRNNYKDNYKDSYKNNCKNNYKDIKVLSISYSKETIRTLFREQLLKLWPIHIGDMDKSYRNFTECCNDLECLYDDFTLKVIKRPIK